MSNITDPFAESVHGTNPQYLIEKITRLKIYNSVYWKEECFGLTAETIIDKAVLLTHCGGVYGGNNQPTKFLCLLLKMLQLQPEKEIVIEFITQDEFKYLRLLGAMYMRMIGKADDVYKYLEPLYNDYRKFSYRSNNTSDGSINGWIIRYIDEFVDCLLVNELECDIALPHIPKRIKLEDLQIIPARVSVLDMELLDDKENEEENSQDDFIKSSNNDDNLKVNKSIDVSKTYDNKQGEEGEEEDDDFKVFVESKTDNEIKQDSRDNHEVKTRDGRDRNRDRDSRERDRRRDSRDRDRRDSRDRQVYSSRRDDRSRYDRRSRSVDKYRDRRSTRYDSRDREYRRRSRSRSLSIDSRDNSRRRSKYRSRSRSPISDKKLTNITNNDDDEDFVIPSMSTSIDIEKETKKKAAQSASKRFDKIFKSTNKSSSNTTITTLSSNIVRKEGDKIIVATPEGTVEYWNQMREALGLKKLK